MNISKKIFLGVHNFKAFTVGEHNNYFCEISSIHIEKKENIIIIKIRGKSFLTHMIRYIIASLILVNEDVITKENIDTMLQTGKRIIEFEKAPASGLYLNEVKY